MLNALPYRNESMPSPTGYHRSKDSLHFIINIEVIQQQKEKNEKGLDTVESLKQAFDGINCKDEARSVANAFNGLSDDALSGYSWENLSTNQLGFADDLDKDYERQIQSIVEYQPPELYSPDSWSIHVLEGSVSRSLSNNENTDPLTFRLARNLESFAALYLVGEEILNAVLSVMASYPHATFYVKHRQIYLEKDQCDLLPWLEATLAPANQSTIPSVSQRHLPIQKSSEGTLIGVISDECADETFKSKFNDALQWQSKVPYRNDSLFSSILSSAGLEQEQWSIGGLEFQSSELLTDGNIRDEEAKVVSPLASDCSSPLTARQSVLMLRTESWELESDESSMSINSTDLALTRIDSKNPSFMMSMSSSANIAVQIKQLQSDSSFSFCNLW